MGSNSTLLQRGEFYGQVAGRREVSGLILSEVIHRSARALPRHMHDRTYVNLLLGGRYEEEIGGRAHGHGPMSVSVLPAGVEHRDRVGNSGARFFIVEMARRWFDRTDAGESQPVRHEALAGTDALWAMLRLYREVRRWDSCSPGIAEELTCAVIAGSRSGSAGEDRHRPSWLSRAEEMVRDGFRGTVTLSDLACEAGVHPAHLSRTFRRYFGRTPGELTRALRVRWVCERITDPRRTLADLAFAAGFADQAHMTRVVMRHVGMSPGQLRALLGARPTSGAR